MQSVIQVAPISKGMLWTGRVMSALPALFLLLDAVMKFVKPDPVVEATVKLGYPENVILPLGVTLLVCTILYLIPRTAVLGAILLTAYLGGAVASNVRAGTPLFNMVFPMLFGVMAWASLVLRDKRLESILLKPE